jgi:phosphatidylglycerophosphatase A
MAMDLPFPALAGLALFNLCPNEIILIAALVLILFTAKRIGFTARRMDRDLMRGLKEGWRLFWKHFRDAMGDWPNDERGPGTYKRAVQGHLDELGRDPTFHRPDYSGEARPGPARWDWKLWVAQGFGVGRVPYAPGTFGTLPGLVWFILLLLPANYWIFLAGILAGLGLSVWLCGCAEESLRQTDPPSVVLDEMTALPICFIPWVTSAWARQGVLPGPEVFLGTRTCWLAFLLFGLFRLFDIFKPWPIRSSQRLPGGWGVTVDDGLAALAVALLTLPFLA